MIFIVLCLLILSIYYVIADPACLPLCCHLRKYTWKQCVISDTSRKLLLIKSMALNFTWVVIKECTLVLIHIEKLFNSLALCVTSVMVQPAVHFRKHFSQHSSTYFIQKNWNILSINPFLFSKKFEYSYNQNTNHKLQNK